MDARLRNNMRIRYVQYSGEKRLFRDRWYTVDEVCEMFRVARSTLWRYLKSGELVGYRLGKGGTIRIKGSAIKAFLVPCGGRPKKDASAPRPATRPAASDPKSAQ